ncbi:MAG: hypothetical protein RJA02_1522 [Armatimonadota bacterium]|jgi:hypothetical protein
MSSDNQDQPDGGDVQPGGLRPPSAERIADVTLGAGVVAIEKLEQVAGDLDNRIRHALADAPQFVDSLEERGRPIRDRILSLIRQRPTVADVFSAAARTEDPSDDKMTALEQRVMELEREHAAVDTDDADPSNKPESPEKALDSSE